MMLEEKIRMAKLALLQNSVGHLSLFYRVELMKCINDAMIVNKVFFECVKYVFEIWKYEYPNNLILPTILNKVNDYLYHQKGDINEFRNINFEYKNYFEEIQNNAGLVGLSAISLCISIVCGDNIPIDIEDYDEEDDNYFDYEDWTSDFLAAMAFSGGNPFLGEGDAGRRREFWSWYLDTVETLYHKSDVPLLKIDVLKKQEVEQNVIPQRIQTYKTPAILLKIQQIIEKSTNVFDNYCTGNWDRIIVEAHCIGDVRTEGCFVSGNISSKMPVSLSTADLLSGIKQDMYDQAKIEGAWLTCKIEFDTKKKFVIEFNYDNESLLPDDVLNDPDRFETEFRKRPRGREYTPIWWQNILGRRAKYIK